MDEMKDFCLWFLNEMPPILLKPPISAFVGMALLLVVCRVISRMMRL